MSKSDNKISFKASAQWVETHDNETGRKRASLVLDLNGRLDALSSSELLIAALAKCIVKGIERVTPILKFELRCVEVRLEGVRQNVPPKIESLEYEILVDSDESDHRLALLHQNVKKYSTVFNTLAPGTQLTGVLRRA